MPGGVRPQVAPLGEPGRIVALVHEGRLERRRRGSLLEAPKAPDRAGGGFRGIDRGRNTGAGLAHFRIVAAGSKLRDPERHPPPFGSAGPEKARRSSGLRSWREDSVRVAVGRPVRRLGSCPAPRRPSWSAECAGDALAVDWPRGLGRAVLQGPRHRQVRCLGALGLFDEAGAVSGRIARDWLWRRGRGTCGFLLFGSPQRCTSNGGAQSN